MAPNSFIAINCAVSAGSEFGATSWRMHFEWPCPLQIPSLCLMCCMLRTKQESDNHGVQLQCSLFIGLDLRDIFYANICEDIALKIVLKDFEGWQVKTMDILKGLLWVASLPVS